jgi:hypothetical protein
MEGIHEKKTVGFLSMNGRNLNKPYQSKSQEKDPVLLDISGRV